MVKALIAGWKEASLIDVRGAVTLTIWFCGCNLRCPFCHNHRLADSDPRICRLVEVRSCSDSGECVEEVIKRSVRFIDYVHVTGGEPLIQFKALAEVFRVCREVGVNSSLNSNLTMPDRLEALINEGLVDHVATDLKVPMKELTGVEDDSLVNELMSSFLKSLKIIAESGVDLELRIPVAKGLTVKHLPKVLGEVSEVLKGFKGRAYIIVNPLLGPPVTSPRNTEWCLRHCWPSWNELREVAEQVSKLGFKVFIGRLPPR